MTVLFICRGNALRSIIAETYLRSLALPNVKAVSCGTIAEENKAANADTYQVTLDVLRSHGLEQYVPHDYGTSLTQTLLDSANMAICMNPIVLHEAVDRASLPDNLLLWDIDDVDEGGRITNTIDDRRRYSEEIYQDIRAKINNLVRQNVFGTQ